MPRALWPLLFLGLGGCVGAVVGTVIDASMAAARYPFVEYVFQGVYKYDNAPATSGPGPEDERGRDYGHELVGIAASGGGSRSAYFLACALDAMRAVEVPPPPGSDEEPRSLLDEVDYLSSVSGGSLASAYYALRRPATSDPATLDAFFRQFRRDMRRHFELRSVGRTLVGFRWLPLLFTYYHRGHVMASTWDAAFFDGATFADLPPARPPHPTLIINATSYSSGQKFLFTRVPTSRFDDSPVFGRLRDERLITEGFDRAHRPLQNAGFDTIDSDLDAYRISHAVVASAGVPNLLGPMVLKDHTEDERFEALGDGGIYDNYGLETLMQLFTTILAERPDLTARIVIVDGSGFFVAERTRTAYTVAGYADRTATIGWLRAGAYAEAFFRTVPQLAAAEADGAPPFQNLRIQVVSLYHQPPVPDGDSGGALEPLRTVYDATVGAGVSTVFGFVRGLNERAKGIGTRFKLSAADADTIGAQAALVVPAAVGTPPSAVPTPDAAAEEAGRR